MKIGIVGLPNVGKSTLFKALTKKQVDISNYPFCTISPNVGVVAVPDERMDKLASVVKPQKVLPTTIEFVDIAGLVAGAHKGEGLGNQFLSHIREVNAIVHVVRAFTDKEVAHVAGAINPEEDTKTVELELILADLAVVERRHQELAPKAHSGETEAKKLLPLIEKVKNSLENEKPLREINLTEEEQLAIRDMNLLTQKPVLYVLNVDEGSIINSKWQIANSLNICAKLEAELADLPEEEARAYMREFGLHESGLTRLVGAGYKLLDLVTFFTTQNDILQAWTVKKGTTANEAAGTIHTDFQEKFIKAEVIDWQELFRAGSWHHAREKGLLRTEGRDYLVQDGDVVYFRI